MAYTNPIRVTYTRTVGTSNAAWTVSPPPGTSQVRVADISASVTTTFTATTTAATFGVGVTGATSTMGVLNFGTTAAAAVLGFTTQKNRTGTGTQNPTVPVLDLTGTSNTITGTPPAAEVSGPILLTYTAMTGGTPAGAAIVDVTLEWF